MKYIRKSLSILLIMAIILILPYKTVMADSNIIYESTTKQTITSGAVLEKITRFTTEGWLGINVLKVDLANSNIKVDTMTNSDSIKKLTSTKVLAQLEGAVAGINGGFFSWGKESGTGDPIGPVVQSGDVMSVSDGFNKYNNSMATFAVDNLDKILLDYWQTSISLVPPDGDPITVSRYNKPYNGAVELTILDRKFTQTSVGSQTYPDIIEMVVDGGKVVDIRHQQPAVQIPENGYVVITRAGNSKLIDEHFKLDDEVGLDIKTTPDWSKLKMAITGGAVLIKDGNIPIAFSHDSDASPRRQPRTAIGSSKDGKQLILVTVDGRQNSSIGMTQKELAQFMLQIGVYNALNLDGGGSTTMVARTPGTSNIDVVNSPSDGFTRGIATAVGVFSTSSPSALDGLIIDTQDANIFVNTSRDFTVKGYDKNYNPVVIKPDEVKWSVTGIQGSFKGSTFYPKSAGEGIIKATIGSVTAQFPISVLTSPVQLTLSASSIKLAPNQTASFAVKGKNKNGYSAVINPADVIWAVKNNLGTVSKGIFTASASGSGYIDASVGNVHVYCSVAVASTKATILDSFEFGNGSYQASPAGLPGKYQMSSEQKKSGKLSGKLTYDFTSLEGTRAAYMIFPGAGYALNPESSVKIGLWVYNTHKNPTALRAWVYDTKGELHYLDLAKQMDWEGWKFVEASLSNIKSPSRIARIYAVQTNPVPDSGSIYMDDLTVFFSSTYPAVDLKQVPKGTVPADAQNKKANYPKSDDLFAFSVFGQSSEPGEKDTTQKTVLAALSNKINNYLGLGAFVGSSRHDIVKSVKKPFVSTNTGNKAVDYKGSRFIQLDMSKNGLRTSSSSQWSWFQQQLASFKGNNIFIFLAKSPQNFSDKLEADLFQDELTRYKQKSGKNVWVFYQGSKNTSYMERGVKYISTAGFDEEGLTAANIKTAKYMLVTVKGSIVTYEIKPVI